MVCVMEVYQGLLSAVLRVGYFAKASLLELAGIGDEDAAGDAL